MTSNARTAAIDHTEHAADPRLGPVPPAGAAPAALGILHPVIGLPLSSILAALAMSFSSEIAISNAGRLKRYTLVDVAAWRLMAAISAP